MYALLATLVLLAHFAFLLFVTLGGFLVLRRPRLAWLHLPLALWGAFVEFSGLICPLTPLENYFRARAGQTPYAGDFIDHYIAAILYPSGLTRALQLALGVGLVLLNAAIYWRVFARHRP
jgi:hypothetical protein